MIDSNPRAASIRVETVQARAYLGQRRHDLRIGPQPDHVATDRAHHNRVLIEPPLPTVLRRTCAQRYALRSGRRLRTDAALALRGILTFGVEAQKLIGEQPVPRQDATFLDVAQNIADRLGTSVDGLVVHLDEAAVHAHFTFCAYGHGGQPLSTIIDRRMAGELQDVAAEVMGNHCPGIERGHRKRTRLEAGATRADVINRSVRTLHETLPAELERARADVRQAESRATQMTKTMEMAADAFDGLLLGTMRLDEDRRWKNGPAGSDDDWPSRKKRLENADWPDNVWAGLERLSLSLARIDAAASLDWLLHEDHLRLAPDRTWAKGTATNDADWPEWKAFLAGLDFSDPEWSRLEVAAAAADRKRRTRTERMALVLLSAGLLSPDPDAPGTWRAADGAQPMDLDGAGTDWSPEEWEWACTLATSLATPSPDSTRDLRAAAEALARAMAKAEAGPHFPQLTPASLLDARHLPRPTADRADTQDDDT